MSLTTELGDFFLLILQMSKRLGKVKSYHSEVRKQTDKGGSGIPLVLDSAHSEHRRLCFF